MPEIDWDDYRYFLATAETGSLSAAARALDTNQPTVGRRIAALESRLGVRLYQRHARGMVLTEAGERLLQAVAPMGEAAHAASRAVTGDDTSLAGSVRVSTPESLGALVIAPQLRDLHVRYPAIEVVLQLTAATADLLRGEADIALRLFRPTAADLVARRVGRVSFGLYAAPAYLAGAPPLARLEDLAAHVQIGYADDLALIPEAVWHSRHAVGAPTALRCSGGVARAAAAASGLGIALLPNRVAGVWPGLVQVLPGHGPEPRDAWVVVHKDLRYVARIRVVKEFIAELFVDAS
ncbi:LysR family transcriptional regulator [Plasticicumulans lactativorans]|uniref:LysR family transcriptional regulator n=1 Tax=Plasticicumulans lactativorans TaxID=1133106 RepID=A0A4R2KZZ8_9GAMM|nr:LysR family transcriptional regulator [Plasticicumulans lactativorans]TCO79714.1 LysR family transcriptional regulator [Plasticicumulans lactativorans]